MERVVGVGRGERERGRSGWKKTIYRKRDGKAKRNWHLIIHWHMPVDCHILYFRSPDERRLACALA